MGVKIKRCHKVMFDRCTFSYVFLVPGKAIQKETQNTFRFS